MDAVHARLEMCEIITLMCFRKASPYNVREICSHC